VRLLVSDSQRNFGDLVLPVVAIPSAPDAAILSFDEITNHGVASRLLLAPSGSNTVQVFTHILAKPLGATADMHRFRKFSAGDEPPDRALTAVEFVGSLRQRK